LYVLQPNIHFFIRNGVKGILRGGELFPKGGELAELRAYLMARLLWNRRISCGPDN